MKRRIATLIGLLVMGMATLSTVAASGTEEPEHGAYLVHLERGGTVRAAGIREGDAP